MARSSEQNRHARAHTRGLLVDAAIELFAERGVEGASIALITRRAGVAQGLVNYYFGGKDQLVAAVIERWFLTLIGIARVTGSAEERLAAIIDGSLSAAVAALPLERAVLAMQQQPSTRGIFAEVEERHADLASAAEDAVRAIFHDRGAEDPALEKTMLRSILEGIVLKYATHEDSYPIWDARRWLYRHYGLPDPAEPASALTSAAPAGTAPAGTAPAGAAVEIRPRVVGR